MKIVINENYKTDGYLPWGYIDKVNKGTVVLAVPMEAVSTQIGFNEMKGRKKDHFVPSEWCKHIRLLIEVLPVLYHLSSQGT